MIDIVLFEPEIPPNTGNIIRLCANAGARLHLVEPLGFRVDDRALERAGLDYHEHTSMQIHPGWAACRSQFATRRMFAISTKGTARYDHIRYAADDVLVFGPESRGLPSWLLGEMDASQVLRVPMRPQSRSLNLSNCVAIVLYEAWRQNGFSDGA
jgi:tRNA (cytidine/uridine-2'-O-)-methyltransferase